MATNRTVYDKKGKWPIDSVEQDTVCINSFVKLLERAVNAVENETRISYWQGFDEEGGSIEIKMLVDFLHETELTNILDFAHSEMKDGHPRVSVRIEWLFDEDWRKHLLEKWNAEKPEYPDCKFVEHFVVDIQMDYTKHDWNELMAYAEVQKKELKKDEKAHSKKK